MSSWTDSGVGWAKNRFFRNSRLRAGSQGFGIPEFVQLILLFFNEIYLLSSLVMPFVTGADRIVLWVTLAYAREYVIQHYAYAPVTKRDPMELSRYVYCPATVDCHHTKAKNAGP